MRGSRRWAVVCILALLLGILPTAPTRAEQASEKKQEFERIKRKIEAEKRKIKKADHRERSVLSEIETLDRGIQARTTELKQEHEKLRAAEADLTAVEQGAAVVERELALLKRCYRGRVRALYKMGRSGYAVGILASESMTAAVKRLAYLGIIAEHDRRLIDDYRMAMDSLARRQTEITGQQEEISRRKEELASHQQDLAGQRKKKEVLLASVRKQKEVYEDVLQELDESSRNLWDLIAREEAEGRKAAQQRNAVPLVLKGGRGRLPWPVAGSVITPYGKQRHPQFGTIVFRRGIEISVTEGEPVHAVSAGRAVFADWYKGYGKLVILEHADGLYSLYGYLSRLDVQKDDAVAVGQAIGLAGEAGSLKGAKLYFEMRRHGEAVDPLAWLAKR